MHSAFDKDKVIVRVKLRNNGLSERLKGEIIKVVQPAKSPILGLVKQQEENTFILPLSEIYPYPLKIDNTIHNLNDNQLVSFYIKPSDKQNSYPTAEIIDTIGYETDENIEEKIVISLFNIRTDYPEDAITQAKSLNENLLPLDERKDLTDQTIFTIDGEDAKDFDDAVSIEQTDDYGYQLGVHIADVSNFIPANSPLDNDAYSRGTSIYFPAKAIHMLPHQLSENICSLQPDKQRLTISVLMHFTKNGKLLNYKIFKSIIKSKARLTYNIVQEILDNPAKNFLDERIKSSLLTMHELANILTNKRINRGALDFDLPEPVVMFDLNSQIAEISKSIRLDSHRIIEEFMIVTNEIIASHLEKNNYPVLYRIHEIPEIEKINNFLTIFQNIGYSIPIPVDYENPKFYQKLLKQIEGKQYANFITYLLLRSFKQAKYSKTNVGHFGLASRCYTHFTSPIRRYPDLFNHRMLSILLDNVTKKAKMEPASTNIEEIAEHCSQAERTADDASRKLINMKRAFFMKQFIGKEFTGIITNMNSKKIFVEIIEHFVEGFIPISSITGDFYVFDESKYTLIGKRYNKKYRLGDLVKVKLIEADPLRSIIELKLL